MNILVISSCTSTKRKKHDKQLKMDDFRDPVRLVERTSFLLTQMDEYGQSLQLTARDMYTGRQHQYVLDGVAQLRKAMGHESTVDLQIVSAGYGLIHESEPILPYEATFNEMHKKELQEYSHRVLRLPEKVKHAVEGYDLVFVLLGEKYLEALNLSSLPPRDGLIFVAGTSPRKWFPRQHRENLVAFSGDEVKLVGGGQIGLKGAVLKHFAAALGAAAPEQRLRVLQQLRSEPSSLRLMMGLPERAAVTLPRSLKPEPVTLKLADVPRAQNSRERPLFFVPNWDDLVNPGYQFSDDTHPQKRYRPQADGAYAHELGFKQPAYDGILISRAVTNKKKSKFDNAKEFVRWQNGPLMGDCGAYSYHKDEFPPYSTNDVLDYYEKHRFDIGVSVDHLIIGKLAKDEQERTRRFRLTLYNAEEFLQKHKQGRYSFTPMGIAQGWDAKSYYKAVEALLGMGYKHIALGGLAYAKSQAVVDILGKVSPLFPPDLYVHMFGLARPELLKPYSQLGVSAFDSATFLRRAWMSSIQNYLGLDGEWYTALRVPPARWTVNGSKGPEYRYHDVISELRDRYESPEDKERVTEPFVVAERQALAALREYDGNHLSMDAALDAVLEYDQMMFDKGDLDESRALYARTLSARPWRKCPCPICSQLQIEVAIFRQNDRNRRRGFHNTYAFRVLEERLVKPSAPQANRASQPTLF